MNWPAIFLGCFVVGFALSALSFAFGGAALHFHVHVPFMHHVHVPTPAAHAGHGGSSVPWLNFATMMAFLAWFGGTGYLLTSEFGWLAVSALTMAMIAGVAGAGVMFWVMSRVLWSPLENMQSGNFQMIGILGRVSQPVRADGTGEMIYSHGGARQSCAARSADGRPIEKDQDVVVTAYDRGIATVRRWEELMADES
jgi:membrane protein implicated in regulation of membrane protease activity